MKFLSSTGTALVALSSFAHYAQAGVIRRDQQDSSAAVAHTTTTSKSWAVIPTLSGTPTTRSATPGSGATVTSGGVIISGTFLPGATTTSGGLIVSGTFVPISSGSSGIVVPGGTGTVIGLPDATVTSGGVIISGTFLPGATTTSGGLIVSGTYVPVSSASSGIVVPGGLITAGPVATTIPAAEVSASASSVSSEIAGLIPIITGWEGNPGAAAGDILTDANQVKNDVDSLIHQLGGDPGTDSSTADCTASANPFDPLGSLLNSLSCIDGALGSIIAGVTAGDPAVVAPLVDTIGNQNNVIGQAGGGITSAVTITSSPVASVSGTTTTTAPSDPSPSAEQCSPDTCGATCSAAGDLISSVLKRSDGTATTLDKRVLPNEPGRPPALNTAINNAERWVTQEFPVSGQFFPFPDVTAANTQVITGINGLYGCTAVIILSNRGIYLSHLWEAGGPGAEGVFRVVGPGSDWANMDASNQHVWQNGYLRLSEGGNGVQGLRDLIENGDLAADQEPMVFVFSPRTRIDRILDIGITTELRFQGQAAALGGWIAGALGPGTPLQVLGYDRVDRNLALARDGLDGRVMIEVDPATPVLEPNEIVTRAQYRIWVDGAVGRQGYHATNTRLEVDDAGWIP